MMIEGFVSISEGTNWKRKLIEDCKRILVTPTKERLLSIRGVDFRKLMENQFHLPAFDVCMEAASVTASATLQLTKCKDGQLPRFGWDKEGKIYLMNDERLCLTVVQGESRKGGGGSPVHLIRNHSMETCSDKLKPFQRWGIRTAE